MSNDLNKVLNYRITKPSLWSDKYFKIAMAALFFMWVGFLNSNQRTIEKSSVQLYQIIIANIAIVAIAYYLYYTNSKSRLFYNNLIIISQKILKDKFQKDSHRIVFNAAESIILYRLEKYDKEIFDEKKRQVDEPYSISYGERCTFWIARYTDIDFLKQFINELEEFDFEKFESIKKRAIEFDNNTENGQQNRYKSATIRSKFSDQTADQLFEAEENEYNENIEKLEEQKSINQQKQTEKAFQLGTGICPYCFKKIPRLARKCEYCTAEL